MQRLGREAFLRTLEQLQSGLQKREIIEQGSCFIFTDGEVMAFNDEVLCRATSPLEDKVTGAVRGDKLLELLRQLPEDEVAVEQSGSHLVVRGKGRKGGVTTEEVGQGMAEAMAKSRAETKKGKWIKLPEDFTEAVGVVRRCAGTDE